MSETAAPQAAARTAPSLTLGFMKLVVSDMPGMADFYARALGLEVVQTIETATMTEQVLRRPGVTHGPVLMLYRHKDGRKVSVGNGHGPVGFYVRDVDAAYAHAVAEGAEPVHPPEDAGTMRFALLADPEGHELEFVSIRS
jgi:predicted enzyme related to lactoylglutathione lyase